MPELPVVVVAQDNEQRAVLQVLVDGTSVARVAHTCASYPGVASDPVLRRIQSANPAVVLVDVPPDSHTLALRSIELIHQEVKDVVVFAVGSMSQPQVIVSAMRAGAREFIERPTTTTDLLEAFVRLTTAQRKVDREGPRGKVFTVVNAKGGSGATTTAVNLALALHSAHGNVALVDIASLGHAALHMNLKPQFTVTDAIRNLHRLDSSLLESFMTR
ncbi:MAG TPA: AAA family ATPase, partial [Terriglobales bacterium]|nr:AAA family ATPase [Terriglobales bacterium]